MDNSYNIIAEGEAAMVALGHKFGAALVEAISGKGIIEQGEKAEGVVVFLRGNLGMGKTTFVRGVMRGLGHVGTVKSPTYTLVEPYEFGALKANHFDLYRLGHPEELEFLGIRDYFTNHSVNLIEWPDKGAMMLPQADVDITITGDSTHRDVCFNAVAEFGNNLLRRFHGSLHG